MVDTETGGFTRGSLEVMADTEMGGFGNKSLVEWDVDFTVRLSLNNFYTDAVSKRDKREEGGGEGRERLVVRASKTEN